MMLSSKNSTKGSGFSLPNINIWDIIVIVITLGVCFFITMNMGGKSYDDAYITFRYARNLAQGKGFCYNFGENYLGTTTPFFTILLASAKFLFPAVIIPSVAQWLTGGALLCLSIFTYLLGRNNGKPIAGMVSALYVLLNPVFVLTWGGESIFLLALIAAAIYFYFRGSELVSAIIIGMAFLTRGEGILLGIILFMYYIVINRKLPLRAIFAFCAVTFPWLIYSYCIFGTPLPSSLQAKAAQMDSGAFSPFLITSFDMFRGYTIGSPNFPSIIPHYSYLIVGIFAFVGLVSLLIRSRQFIWWSIVLWLILYSIGYSLIDVPFYHWYSIPLLYGGIILAGLGTQFLYDLANKKLSDIIANIRRIVFVALFLIAGLPLVTGFIYIKNYLAQPISPVQKLYSNTGKWLDKNTPSTSSVGYFEIGFMGYYSDRTFIDPVGLVNPGVSEQVAKGDFKWAYLHYKPDYLVINPVRWYERIGNIRDESWFNTAYQEAGKIEENGYFDAPIIIYQKINDESIPKA
ncbi:MAG: hypothetical protein Q8Q33_01830 [Chlamydiota bacterium]|nr:hypothetical protein [Chlamydiota bacterium]